MAEIVLCTVNARYYHASFGLRCLYAQMGELQPRTRIIEFEGRVTLDELVTALRAEQPRIAAFGIYIWNTAFFERALPELRRALPGTVFVLGGPEVSHDPVRHPLYPLADVVLCGEADTAFADVCRGVLAGQRPPRVLHAPRPDPAALSLPYGAYSDTDLAQRVVYVEATRGCPGRCAFCMSALEPGIRSFPINPFLEAMEALLARGARRFNFVDRSFNATPQVYEPVLTFFSERMRPGLEIHLELLPTLLPERLKQLLLRFPPGALRLEVGIQSFDEAVNRRIGRPQSAARAEENLRWLAQSSGAHVHADLIAGLPGETPEGVAAGFDRLLAIGPTEIQLGILKLLPGAPLAQFSAEWGMRYNPRPPYDLIENGLIDAPAFARIKRFARFWEITVNRNRLPRSVPLLWEGQPSAFHAFMAWSDWLYGQLGRTHRIPLMELATALWRYLLDERLLDPATVTALVQDDYRDGGRRRPLNLPSKNGAEP